MNELKRWTAIHVSLDTRNQLEKLRDLWTGQASLQDSLGTAEIRSGKESTKDQIGYDQVIRRLIVLVKRHRDRGKKSGKAKAQRRREKEGT